MRRAGIVLASAAVVAAGLLAPPAAASDASAASIGLSLVDGPTDDRGGLAQDRISHVLSAGDDATWTVEVTNTGTAPATVAVYAGAASLDGGQFRPDDEAPSELTGWISTSPSEVEVAAGSDVEVTVDLQVPQDATDGDHAGVIWAAASSGEDAGAIERVNRIGIRALITVADGQPAAGFEIERIGTESVTEEAGEHLLVEVTNTGGRMVEVAGNVDLHDGPGGVSAGELPLPPTTIATGDTVRLATTLDEDLPAGRWTADATVIGDHLSDQATATVTIGQATTKSADSEGARTPLISLALLLLIATFLALVAVRRRTRDDDRDPEPERELAVV